LFKEKSRKLDGKALIEFERHRSIQDSRKFYKRLNDVKRQFDAQVAMCRAKNSELLTKKDQVLAKCKEHFKQHLNEGEEPDQPPDQVELRDDRAGTDLPNREEIKSTLKYLQNNKAAGADWIAAELLKNGGPQLVDARQCGRSALPIWFPVRQSTTDHPFALRQINKINENKTKKIKNK
jgi:hypothetical protein